MRQPYATDLTDTQWGHLLAGVFSGDPDPDRTRAVVDGLRYREEARVPWHLLPAGFPPAEALRARHAQWAADGTWREVGRVVAAYPAPRFGSTGWSLSGLADRFRSLPGGATIARAVVALPGLVRAVRRRVARTARRAPGGATALAPGRWLIQAVQATRRQFTVYARLPGWFAEAHARLYLKQDYTGAAELLTRVLTYDPYNAVSYIRRADCYLRLGRQPDAVADCLTALSFPDLKWGDRAIAHALLSQATLLTGDPTRAVAHAQLYRRIIRDGAAVRWDLDDPDGPDEYAALIDLHRDLAEYAINARTDFATANVLYGRAEAVRADYARWLATAPARTLYLSEDWTRAIGHMALIDFWVKIQRLGWRSWDRMVLVLPPGKVANPAYAGYYDRYFETIRQDPLPPALGNLVTSFGPRVAGLLTLPGGDQRYFIEGMGAIQEAWESAGHGPLLTLTPEDEAHGRDRLRALGLPDGAWFVALHVRSPGFHKEGTQLHQSHRNADVETYLPAVREVIARGGWVVRLGDPSMPRLPEMPGLIDYAHSPLKDPRTDVFLCGGCRFFVGVASGLCHVPTTFGVPCVLTNWLSNALPVYSGRDLFLPKLLRSTATGRLLPFDEYLSPETRLLSYSWETLTENGLAAVDNTPDELRDGVAEMLDQLEAGKPAARVAAFDAIARGHGLIGFARLGRAFAEKHAGLLAPAGAGGSLGRAA
ncbi:MAG TPA: TIGR04372 family glycosyltransferase [Urbifossiella sp.]|nr:TIGR04372 family glycosyltransferase [Urbifossiella sp.]